MDDDKQLVKRLDEWTPESDPHDLQIALWTAVAIFLAFLL